MAMAVLLAAAGAGLASSVLSDDDAADLVDRFCTTLIVAEYDPNSPGPWPPDNPEVFGSLVTPELASMIEEAASLNAAFEAGTDEKGPLGDGVPWKAYQDAASECAVGAISGSPEHPEVEIEYRYYDEPESSWADRLVLARHDDGWRIDDIRYGYPDFDASLRSVLATAIDELTP
jgi:hypothetical protein